MIIINIKICLFCWFITYFILEDLIRLYGMPVYGMLYTMHHRH